MPSGTKLVAGIACLALVLGVISWLYRFDSAHRSTEFWGPVAAELIAKPSTVTAMRLVPAGAAEGDAGELPVERLTLGDVEYVLVDVHDVTEVPGIVHLRNSLLSDRNYDWQVEVAAPSWRWGLRLTEGGQAAAILFSEDYRELGLWQPQSGSEGVRALACRPMAETLTQYFASVKLFDASTAGD